MELKQIDYQAQLARVVRMEALCDQIAEALESDDAKARLTALKSEIQKLDEYYQSSAWREDFEAEREGAFPKDLKRGILTEDTLYDLLCDVDRYLDGGDDGPSELNYRHITAHDDAAMAKIVRDNLKKHHLDIPGTAYFDENLDHLSNYYTPDAKDRAYYVVVDEQDKVIGGIGFCKFDGLDNCAELQKLYLSSDAQGNGLGYKMIRLVEENARELGYKTLYLETHTNLEAAVHIYEKYGFREIECPASVGHSAMNKFYELDL